MAMQIGEVRDWLRDLTKDGFRSSTDLVAIGEGGLDLVDVIDPDNNYIEVGGIPEEAKKDGKANP